jgi:hypothetical protein
VEFTHEECRKRLHCAYFRQIGWYQHNKVLRMLKQVEERKRRNWILEKGNRLTHSGTSTLAEREEEPLTLLVYGSLRIKNAASVLGAEAFFINIARR